MIGLKRGIVELMPHQDGWYDIAQKTIDDMKLMLGNIAVDIQHVGSTSIKNISAKPIIDIAVGVNSFDDIMKDDVIEKLSGAGYIHKPSNDNEVQRYFNCGDDEKDMRTHHIHVVIFGDEEWNNYIRFRDYLNNSISMAKAYNRLKQELMTEYKHDRGKYTEMKAAFILSIIQEAKDMELLGNIYTVVVDRPINSVHPKINDMIYDVNYGYVEGIMGGDGDEQDVYILGIDTPVDKFTGKLIAIIKRADDDEDKWVVAPDGMEFAEPYIRDKTYFTEQYFDSSYICMYEKSCGGIIYTYINGIRHYLLCMNQSDYWGFTKGHMENDENEIETAVREIKEETGLDVVITGENPLFNTYKPNGVIKKTVVYFPVYIEYTTSFEYTHEIKKCRWFTYEEALLIVPYNDTKELLNKVNTSLNII